MEIYQKLPKPKSHSKINFIDKQSISLIEHILATHGRVMPKLDCIDKWPNIDGYVEIQNGDYHIVGRLNVQVKTLSRNHNLKLRCPLSFFSSCEIEPCLLFGVDRKFEKVYWLYFDSYKIKKIDFKNNKHTKTIYFSADDYFDTHNKGYIAEWEEIAKCNRFRFENYDKLEKDFNTIQNNTNKATGVAKKHFAGLHIFLDILNSKLEKEFLIIKECFFPGAWKIGIAVYAYEPDSISYILYPIPFEKNDVQIKEVEKIQLANIMAEGLVFIRHKMENPIIQRPKEYALKIIRSKTSKVLENRALRHAGSDFLAREFIFAFIDKFHKQMGLKKKNKYTIKEIKKVLTGMATNVLHRTLPPSYVNNKQISFDIFLEFINFLQQQRREEVDRPYIAKDYSRLKKMPVRKKGVTIGSISLGWNVFSKEIAEKNLKIFFQHLPEVYNVYLKNNFPYLQNSLSLFDKADCIAVVWDLKEYYTDFHNGPKYQMFYLSSMRKKGAERIFVLTGEEAEQLKNLPLSVWEVVLRGERYNIQSQMFGKLDFIYDDTPMLNFIYDILEDRLKKYFEGTLS